MSKNRIRPTSGHLPHPVIVNHNGYLGYTHGWGIDHGRPVEVQVIKVSKIKAENWSDLVGLEITNWQGSVGQVWKPYASQPVIFYADSFTEKVTLERPLSKPRNGKDSWGRYHWVWVCEGWSDQYWEKVYDKESDE